MVTLTKGAVEEMSVIKALNKKKKKKIRRIDVRKGDAKREIVKACEEYGFFKVVNHGVAMELIRRVEAEATKLFGKPLTEKLLAAEYGHNKIGNNGDVGWIEYLLINITPHHHHFPSHYPLPFRCAVGEYVEEVRRMACEVLELMAEGLTIQPRDALSKLLRDDKSDSVLRLNHYPPCPAHHRHPSSNPNRIGFGEHTDPQIISVLRSNNTCGLQILLPDSTWLSVPPDQDSFFFIVGDSLQVMTNGRFKSVRHRVLTNSFKSRMSMIYFGGPPMSARIAPLPSLLSGPDDDSSLYNDFTWFEYKSCAYNSRLADNRLRRFQKSPASSFSSLPTS